MSNFTLTARTSLLAALTGVIALTNLHAHAATAEPEGLFSAQSAITQVVPSKEAKAGKTRAVKINKDKLSKGRFFVSLPGGVSYEVVRESHKNHGRGRSSWSGHAADDAENTVVLGVSGDAVAGTFNYHGKMFKLEPRANGSHVLSEVDSADPAPELDPIPVADTTSTATTSSAGAPISADTLGSVIDVLVAYTPAVQSLYGTAGAEALVLQAVAEANQAYTNSGMKTRLNLVRTVLTSYAESGDMNTDLTRLRTSNDGYMDEILALRDTHGADVVNLLENAPQYCGLAYRMATLSSSFAANAFSVVHHSCATGYYSFAHEIGHNQGAHHDAANATGAIFPYAYGYQDPNRTFRTVMAYDCAGGCARIPYFSNAEVLYNGVPTGTSGSAENADTIENTAATVAAFRSSTAPTPPAAPAGLSAVAKSPSQIDLSWTDQSSNESGFILERSVDGLNFAQIASLVANSNKYSNVGLTANTLYYYRARAWNSNGNSGYTTVATTATGAAAKYIEQVVEIESTTAGTLTGTFPNTWTMDASSESIREIYSAGTRSKRFSYLEHYWAIQVKPGTKVTLTADVSTSAATQSFTFAYSTFYAGLAANPTGWVNMFTVTGANPGTKQFTLPANSPTGWFFISVRDNNRVQGLSVRDTITVNYLAIRTE
jgi:hypothetical protein